MEELSGAEKAALLLTYLGEEAASDIIKFLEPDEIQMLGRKVTELSDAPKDTYTIVADEFEKQLKVDGGPVDADEYLKSVIHKALGPEKASSIMRRISSKSEGGGIGSLKGMNPKLVADFIRNEHPQTIAVVLTNLSPEHAAQVITFFDKRTRIEVIMRVATMEPLAPGAMEELEDAINQNLAGTVGLQMRQMGGVKSAAEILNQTESESETEILSVIEKKNMDLATKIQENMFVFADIGKIDDRGVQRILKEITNEQLILALKTAEDPLKDLFLNNMSERAKEMLLEEMEARGPVKLSDVNAAQLEIVSTTRKLMSDGEIMAVGDAGDAYV